MALSGVAGRAMAGTVGPGARPQQTQPKPIAAPRPPKPAEESEDAPARPKAIGVVAELRALVELRDSGVLTQEKFIANEQELDMALRERQLAQYGTCPQCGAPIEKDFVVCPVCDTQVRNVCPSCHRPLDAHWKVCPYCRTRIQ